MDKFRLHIPSEENRVSQYKCGLIAGQQVRLKKDLVFRNHDDTPTGTIRRAGEIWTVLYGTTTDPVLWFRQSDGVTHTWDDDSASVDEWFERL